MRQDELEAFKQAFDMFDKNSDGTISTKVREREREREREGDGSGAVKERSVRQKEAALHRSVIS